MRRLALAISVTITPLVAGPAFGQAVSIPTTTTERDYYPWITELSAGPVKWSGAENTDTAGYFYRAIVTTSEIYNDLYIEYMTLGDEGCCRRVASARYMIPEEFNRAFGIRGEFTGLSLTEWRDSDTLVVTVQERRFVVALRPEGDLLIEELQRP